MTENEAKEFINEFKSQFCYITLKTDQTKNLRAAHKRNGINLSKESKVSIRPGVMYSHMASTIANGGVKGKEDWATAVPGIVGLFRHNKTGELYLQVATNPNPKCIPTPIYRLNDEVVDKATAAEYLIPSSMNHNSNATVFRVAIKDVIDWPRKTA